MDVLSKVLQWLKGNWMLVLGTVLVALWAWQSFSQGRLVDTLTQEHLEGMERHRRDLDALVALHAQERAEQEEINERLQLALEKVDAQYRERLEALEARTTQRRAVFVQETDGNPDAMAQRLRERLGWAVRR